MRCLKNGFRSFPSMYDRLIYKMFMRSCVFNDIKHDKKVFFCVALLDFCMFDFFWLGHGHAMAD